MNGKKIIPVIMLLLFLMSAPFQVFAAEEITAQIPFTIKNTTGTVVIEAAEGAPLPHQTVFEDVTEGKFELSFSEPGDYCYKIYQNPGTEQGVTYDGTVYEVCVSVFVREDGELYSVVSVNTEGSSEKADELVFENTPEPSTPTSPGGPQTGDNSHLNFWIVLTATSFIVMIGCFPIRKNTNEKCTDSENTKKP